MMPPTSHIGQDINSHGAGGSHTIQVDLIPVSRGCDAHQIADEDGLADG